MIKDLIDSNARVTNEVVNNIKTNDDNMSATLKLIEVDIKNMNSTEKLYLYKIIHRISALITDKKRDHSLLVSIVISLLTDVKVLESIMKYYINTFVNKEEGNGEVL